MIFAAFILTVALALLGLRDLCRKLRRRLADRLARGAEPMAGHGLDARAVTPRISAVRQDYLAAIHAREHESEYHQELLDSARAMVSQMGFFKKPTDGNTSAAPG